MPDLTPEQQKALDATLGSLNRMAMKLVSMPKEGRAEQYAIVRRSMEESVHALTTDQEAGAKWVEQYMTFLRQLVEMIEAGGGAAGGRA